MCLGTWLGTLIALALILASIIYSIQVEEKTRLDTFGDEYRRCMAKSWRFLSLPLERTEIIGMQQLVKGLRIGQNWLQFKGLGFEASFKYFRI